MNEITISTLALALCMVPAIVHAPEVLYPMTVRWLVNWVLALFEPALPQKSKFITNDEQIKMLDAALEAAPKDKKTAAEDYIFILLFEQRQDSLALWAVFAGAIYGMMSPLADRNILHLMLLVMSVLFLLVNANQAGIPFFGKHPKVSHNGRNVGIAFSVFWLAASVLNYLAFTYALG